MTEPLYCSRRNGRIGHGWAWSRVQSRLYSRVVEVSSSHTSICRHGDSIPPRLCNRGLLFPDVHKFCIRRPALALTGCSWDEHSTKDDRNVSGYGAWDAAQRKGVRKGRRALWRHRVCHRIGARNFGWFPFSSPSPRRLKGAPQYRAKNDMVNPVAAGFLSGGILARSQGPRASLGGAVAFAAFSAAIDLFLRREPSEYAPSPRKVTRRRLTSSLQR